MYSSIELTQRLITMKPCTTEAANETVGEVVKILRAAGVQCEVLENEGHLMVVAWIGTGARTLMLNGHLDVVPGNVEQYIPYIENERLYGRGSYDMLGACAVMIMLMCELANRQLNTKVILTLSTTEETNGAFCTKYILDSGFTGDFAICGEPTNLCISVMSKGVFRVKITVYGKTAHSSRPWLGENALVKAMELFHKIEQLPFAHQKNKYFNGASINLSKLDGGLVINQVPDIATMILDIRSIPGYKPKDILSEINSIGGDFCVEIISTGDAVMVDENNEYLKMLERMTQFHTGKSNLLIGQHGTADTIYFQGKGIPSVEFGPIGAGHHGSMEYVLIESLETYRKILLDMINELEHKGSLKIEKSNIGGEQCIE